MRTLKINALCGVKNQMYCSDQYVDTNKLTYIQNDFFDINSLFWSKIFSPKHVKELIESAKIRLKNDSSPKVQAVLNKPLVFFETYIEALRALEIPVTEKQLFNSLETLEIICHLHSKIFSAPFILTIAQGYLHSEYSALDLKNICQLPFCNPYLSFIESEIIPQILDYQPDLLLLSGKPNIASFAIAKIVREQFQNVLIIAAEHESEYYSLIKIKNLLLLNTAFFSVYHCVILKNTERTLEQLSEIFFKDISTNLSSVPDIIYSLDSGESIFYTSANTEFYLEDVPDHISKEKVINLKAFPENHCYWNKCSFCGINSKYENQKNQAWNIDESIIRIKRLYSLGNKKIWFLDEAVPAKVLHHFAEQLIFNNIHIIWHTRARIDPYFTDNSFVKLLRQAGLRHILFGFESASERILQLVHKTNGDFNYLETAEQIVYNFSSNGIAVHFSSIIGFPSETPKERNETCDFLKYIFKTYIGFSYNINTFYLDIKSEIYKRWENFDILNLSYPCAPKYFLENHLDWNSSVSSNNPDAIQQEQESTMLQQYSWYPKGALINPNVFFSFWEYSRYALWKISLSVDDSINLFLKEQPVLLSPKVSFCNIGKGSWLLYHLQNHHYVIGGSILKEIVNVSEKELSFNMVIKKYDIFYRSQVIGLIKKLTRMDFFILK